MNGPPLTFSHVINRILTNHDTGFRRQHNLFEDFMHLVNYSRKCVTSIVDCFRNAAVLNGCYGGKNAEMLCFLWIYGKKKSRKSQQIGRKSTCPCCVQSCQYTFKSLGHDGGNHSLAFCDKLPIRTADRTRNLERPINMRILIASHGILNMSSRALIMQCQLMFLCSFNCNYVQRLLTRHFSPALFVYVRAHVCVPRQMLVLPGYRKRLAHSNRFEAIFVWLRRTPLTSPNALCVHKLLWLDLVSNAFGHFPPL